MVEPNCVLCGSVRDTTTTSTVASTRTMWLPWKPHGSRTFWAWCPPTWGAGCRPSSSFRRKWQKTTSSAWRNPLVHYPQPQEQCPCLTRSHEGVQFDLESWPPCIWLTLSPQFRFYRVRSSNSFLVFGKIIYGQKNIYKYLKYVFLIRY